MKKYDFVLGLGYNCSTTRYLRALYIQEHSYPFDWLYGSDLETRLSLILNDFKDNLLFSNLSIISQNKNDKYRRIIDNKTKLCYIHDFSNKLALIDSYNEIYSKYQRRINRTYDKIKESKKVAFFAILSESDTIDINKLKTYNKLLEDKFSTKIDLIVLKDNKEKSKEVINGNIIFIEDNFLKKESLILKDQVMGNNKLIAKTIKKYINIKFKNYKIVKEHIYKNLFNIILLFILNKDSKKTIKKEFRRKHLNQYLKYLK